MGIYPFKLNTAPLCSVKYTILCSKVNVVTIYALFKKKIAGVVNILFAFSVLETKTSKKHTFWGIIMNVD
jgi:hypothetical protein